ncbi:hypothetical protein GCM10010991_37360 [Gemmobacter aquaticus]|uniref:Uncharacterized protein n=1 Tax=Gemmobacter aquaticus TaxID=490185 RepID=A0A918DEM6_9RHOB|nr:hypothetical protein GCM10010991_37360 [Gemmobacter aquaticus]
MPAVSRVEVARDPVDLDIAVYCLRDILFRIERWLDRNVTELPDLLALPALWRLDLLDRERATFLLHGLPCIRAWADRLRRNLGGIDGFGRHWEEIYLSRLDADQVALVDRSSAAIWMPVASPPPAFGGVAEVLALRKELPLRDRK